MRSEPRPLVVYQVGFFVIVVNARAIGPARLIGDNKSRVASEARSLRGGRNPQRFPGKRRFHAHPILYFLNARLRLPQQTNGIEAYIHYGGGIFIAFRRIEGLSFFHLPHQHNGVFPFEGGDEHPEISRGRGGPSVGGGAALKIHAVPGLKQGAPFVSAVYPANSRQRIA